MSLSPVSSAFDDGKAARAEQTALAIEFARLYVGAFVQNPAGAKLLAHWTKTLAHKRVAVNASLNDYVATEAVRTFIESIHEQISIATSSPQT